MSELIETPVVSGESQTVAEEPQAPVEESRKGPRNRQRRAVVEKPVEETPRASKEEVKPQKVAVFVDHPVFWPNVGRLPKGFNLLEPHVAERWVASGRARIVTPEEVAAAYGV